MSDAHKAEKVLVPSDTDWISALPDDVLGNILGRLPADEAVRTCVLSRRWIHQWKFMRCLRVTSQGVWKKSADDLNKFMSGLLLLRDTGSTLYAVVFDFTYEPSQSEPSDSEPSDREPCDGDSAYPNIWIRHVLLCQAQVLSITLFSEWKLVFHGPPLVSKHLRILVLMFLDLNGSILDFSSCPSLEVLKLTECIIGTGKISSPSVKRLSIRECAFCHDSRTRISVPSITHLHLDGSCAKAPFLESNTSLKTAFLSPNLEVERCEEGDSRECCGTCAKCCGNDDHNSGCVLLGGLSSATYLKMVTGSPGQIIFRRDLKWCPTFVKLKKLFLDGWCVEYDLRALFACLNIHQFLRS